MREIKWFSSEEKPRTIEKEDVVYTGMNQECVFVLLAMVVFIYFILFLFYFREKETLVITLGAPIQKS